MLMYVFELYRAIFLVWLLVCLQSMMNNYWTDFTENVTASLIWSKLALIDVSVASRRS